MKLTRKQVELILAEEATRVNPPMSRRDQKFLAKRFMKCETHGDVERLLNDRLTTREA